RRVARRIARQPAGITDDVGDRHEVGGRGRERRRHLVAGRFEGKAEDVEAAGDVRDRRGREGRHCLHCTIILLAAVLNHEDTKTRKRSALILLRVFATSWLLLCRAAREWWE